MSRNLLERVLYQLCVDRSAKQRFKESPEQFLARHALSEQERDMVLHFDVKALQAYGVNSMLTMGFWQELSPTRDMNAYMACLRDVHSGEAVFSAALK
ncbi:MAG: hypothetical protein ABW202_16570 [Duganella sp.]